MSSIEIESSHVIKLIMQFLKENSLFGALNALQAETQTSLNMVESTNQFMTDINNGNWAAVMQQISSLSLPVAKLVDLFELMVLEMVEMREIDAGKALLRETEPMQHLKATDSDRFARLEQLLSKLAFDGKDLYGAGVSRADRRQQIADDLVKEVAEVPPSRLMSLLGQALKWQQHSGLLPPGTEVDLFRGSAQVRNENTETVPNTVDKVIKFGSKSHAECAAFSSDGQWFVTGSVDGFVEVYDYNTGKLRKDLQYQAEERYMMHDDAVLAVAFSRDCELLVSASQNGKVKVWKIQTGQCLRKFDAAHSRGITSVMFNRDGTQVLTSSYDNLVRIHGLKSSKMLKEFRGHTAFVNDAKYTLDYSQVLSASSDGNVKLWDVKSATCLHTMRPPGLASLDVTVNCIIPMPKASDQFVVCTRQPVIHIMNVVGHVVKTFAHPTGKASEFVNCSLSPKGEYLLCVGRDANLYCYHVESGKLEHTVKLHDKEATGIVQHPHRGLFASFSNDGTVRLWHANQ
eukprot:TRINITY_DN486_c0_g1_i2.p1 TRINITY_DN486_c0_g1~~TRINITY_DN486_c0_g1_i2.p1  ORF type:complete len:516 (+),score=109.85 TRINITY_DN486_c0_g1_i2:378-1925(+)